MIRNTLCFAVIGMIITGSALAAENVGFLTDYGKLKSVNDSKVDKRYIAAGAFEKLQDYEVIFIHQPEIFISPDSKYQGMKPDDAKAISDLLQAAITENFRNDYLIADAPGEGVLVIRTALTDLHLKKKLPFTAFMPVGAIVYGIKQGVQDLEKRLKFQQITIEVEISDGKSGDVLAAATTSRGKMKDKKAKQKADPSSWEEIVGLFDEIGERVHCKLDNARRDPGAQVDCAAENEVDDE